QAARLVTCHRDGTLRTWDLDREEPVVAAAVAGESDIKENIIVSPDGRWAVTFKKARAPHDETLSLFDLESGLHLREKEIRAAAFSRDSHFLAATGRIGGRGSAVVWDLSQPNAVIYQTLITQEERLTAIAFAPSNMQIVIGSSSGNIIF